MSVVENDAEEIVRVAYRLAWQQFNLLILSPDEKLGGCAKLRDYIEMLAASGEQDPAKISASAVGLIREYHQIRRSQASIIVSSTE
jgi:hypothetical protein